MSELIQVRKKSQVTLPTSARKKLGIEEGDFLDVKVKDGQLILSVKKLIDNEQAWFWTKRWQEGEKAVDENIRQGKVYHFENVDTAISFLEASASKKTKSAKKLA